MLRLAIPVVDHSPTIATSIPLSTSQRRCEGIDAPASPRAFVAFSAKSRSNGCRARKYADPPIAITKPSTGTTAYDCQMLQQTSDGYTRYSNAM